VTVVGCGSATGFMVPPVFITELTCKQRSIGLMLCGRKQGHSVSKGFMTASIFLVWLDHFSNGIPDTVKHPIVLVYDGYGSHFNEKIVSKAEDCSCASTVQCYSYTPTARCGCLQTVQEGNDSRGIFSLAAGGRGEGTEHHSGV
jgi:hypothetical protein